MESQDPLSALADIHLPGAISAWPPAIGWWVLAFIMLGLLIYARRHFILHLIRQKRLLLAVSELDNIYQNYQTASRSPNESNQAGLTFLQGVNSILRRVALLKYSSLQIHHEGSTPLSKLHGRAWLSFLDNCDNNDSFCAGPGQALADGVYQRNFTANVDEIYHLSKEWINRRYLEKEVTSFPQQLNSAQSTQSQAELTTTRLEL